MNRVIPIAIVLLILPVEMATAATVLFCPFESLEGWSVRSVGAASAEVVDKSGGEKCVTMASRRGTIFLSRELPLEAVLKRRITVSCLVRTEDVARGAQLSSTAKVHLAVETSDGIRHHSAQLTGSKDWHHEGFTADVPDDARRVVLNLGLEACSGRVFFDRLIVRNDARGVHPLDISRAANASHAQLGLTAFPKGTVEWEGIPFEIMDPARHHGADCFRLKGIGHEDWPDRIGAPIPVGSGASAIYILHGALDGRESSDTPCAMWSAWFVGGQSSGLSLFEGREIGAIGQTEDADSWSVAWREKNDEGRWVTFGVTKWPMYVNTPIVELTCRAYRGASPVVLAVTVVEEPPEPEPEPGDFDEMGNAYE